MYCIYPTLFNYRITRVVAFHYFYISLKWSAWSKLEIVLYTLLVLSWTGLNRKVLTFAPCFPYFIYPAYINQCRMIKIIVRRRRQNQAQFNNIYLFINILRLTGKLMLVNLFVKPTTFQSNYAYCILFISGRWFTARK